MARCPVCSRELPPRAAAPEGGGPAPESHRPFCSERCKLVDLGRWLSGDYVIPGAVPTFEQAWDGVDPAALAGGPIDVLEDS